MIEDAVEQHYTSGDLRDRVLAALVGAGHDPDALGVDALAPAEEFHTFGRMATIALADAAGVSAADNILDVGSGLGGPARLLARRYGCRVTGIDLTQEFCDVATDLTRRVGMSDQVEFQCANALALPFQDDTFDLVWTQHMSMNIAQKPAMYAEMRRVTKATGRLAFFDILAGPEQPIHFPVPWAGDESVSFLSTAEQTRADVETAGFVVQTWDDLTQQALDMFAQTGAPPPAPSPIGLHLLIADLPIKIGNLKRSVEERRIVVVRCVATAT